MRNCDESRMTIAPNRSLIEFLPCATNSSSAKRPCEIYVLLTKLFGAKSASVLRQCVTICTVTLENLKEGAIVIGCA